MNFILLKGVTLKCLCISVWIFPSLIFAKKIQSIHDWFWSEVGEWKKGKELELDELDDELNCVSIN